MTTRINPPLQPFPFCYRGYTLLQWEMIVLKDAKRKGIIPKHAHFRKYAINPITRYSLKIYRQSRPGYEKHIATVGVRDDYCITVGWLTPSHPTDPESVHKYKN